MKRRPSNNFNGFWRKVRVDRICLLTVFLAITLLISYGFAGAGEFKAWKYTQLPDTPEGIGIDSQGNLYAALFHTGELVRLEENGAYTHIAWVLSKEASGEGELVGLDTDKHGNIFVAYKGHSKYDNLMDPHHPGCKDVTEITSGVYRIDAKTHEVTAVATRGDGWPFCFPDDVDIDDAGNIYLTDLTYSGLIFSLKHVLRKEERKWLIS